MSRVTVENCLPLVEEYCREHDYLLSIEGVYHAAVLTVRHLSRRLPMEEQETESAVYAGVYDALLRDRLKGYC